MHARIGEVFTSTGQLCRYEYDCMLPVVDSPRMGVCGYTGSP